MRSLGTIRARVERLAAFVPLSSEPTIIHLVMRARLEQPAVGVSRRGRHETT